MQDIVKKLYSGYKSFFTTIYTAHQEFYKNISYSQRPGAMIIACCDSRVDPVFLTQANLGDAFIVRNIANIIPPFGHDSVHEHQGTIAALEYAVLNLKIENIIVLGHSSCGGIKALMDNSPDTAETLPNIHRWLKILEPVRLSTCAALGSHAAPEEKYRYCEIENINNSLQNLHTYPWIKQKIENEQIKLCGWYFDLKEGHLFTVDYNTHKLIMNI